MAAFTEYTRFDALGLAELVRKGEVSSTELVEACIENPSFLCRKCFRAANCRKLLCKASPAFRAAG